MIPNIKKYHSPWEACAMIVMFSVKNVYPISDLKQSDLQLPVTGSCYSILHQIKELFSTCCFLPVRELIQFNQLTSQSSFLQAKQIDLFQLWGIISSLQLIFWLFPEPSPDFQHAFKNAYNRSCNGMKYHSCQYYVQRSTHTSLLLLFTSPFILQRPHYFHPPFIASVLDIRYRLLANL